MPCKFSCIVPLGFTTAAIALRSLWTPVSLICVCEDQKIHRRPNLDGLSTSILLQKTPPPHDWLQIG